MFKFLLVVIVLFVACGAAMVLVARLNRIAAQLADLKRDLTRNDERLRARMQATEAEAVRVRQEEEKSLPQGGE